MQSVRGAAREFERLQFHPCRRVVAFADHVTLVSIEAGDRVRRARSRPPDFDAADGG